MLTREFIENEINALDLVVTDEDKIDEVIRLAEESIFSDDYLSQSILSIVDDVIFDVGFPGIDEE